MVRVCVRACARRTRTALGGAAGRSELHEYVVEGLVGLADHIPVELEGDELAHGEWPLVQHHDPPVPSTVLPCILRTFRSDAPCVC